MAADALAEAWALKAACYEAWHTEPQRTRAAADALAALAAADPRGPIPALAAWTDGIALLAQGRLLQGLVRLEEAEALFAALEDAQHAAETQVPQMVALSFLGREAEVVERGERALAKFIGAGDERSAGKVEINLGTSLTRQDRPAEAERMYRRAANRFAGIGDVELTLMAEIGLANTLTWQFRLDEAFDVAATARERARHSGLAILHAQTLEATGQIELHRGRWREALSALAEALRILEVAGASPQRRLECETALADAYARVNLLAEAEQWYQRIIEEAAALPAPNEVAWATLLRARVLGRSGRYEAALEGLAAAREQYLALENLASIALTDLCAARVELALGRWAEALESATRAALALQGRGIAGWWLEARTLQAAARAGAGDLEAAREAYATLFAEAVDLPQIAFECHAGWGAALLGQGEFAAARIELEHALQQLDVEREALPFDELRSALGGEAAQVHEHLISTALAVDDPVRLLVDIERGRARALAQGIVVPWPEAAPESPSSALPDRLRRLRKAWREAVMDNDEPRLSTLGEQVQAVERALLEEHRRAGLRAGMPPRQRPPASSAGLDVPALQRELGAHRALVAYHMHGDRVLIVVVTDREVLFREGDGESIGAHIAGLRFQIGAARQPAVAKRHAELLEARLRAHAVRLYDGLWAPLEADLADREEVIVVPHGALHDLPFGLLCDGRQWLVERKVLSLAPSAAVWLALARRPATGSGGAVLAIAAAGRGLAHVEREVDAVVSVFGPAAVTLRGAEATLDAVRDAASTPWRVLHVACHARFRADNPAFSSLMLSDGPLPMHELALWRLSAPLVVLSACQTGVSRVAPGDEAFGLVRAILLAGGRSVLATQWAVDDEATASLVHRFYERLHAGAAPGHALQQAQADAALRGLHPYLWGAFALHGPA